MCTEASAVPRTMPVLFATAAPNPTDRCSPRAQSSPRANKARTGKSYDPSFGASYSASYTLKADVYSVGMLLWTISTRAQPFEGLRTSAVMRAVKAGERPPCLVAGSAPEHYRFLVDACLHHDPQQRPAVDHVLDVLLHLPDEFSSDDEATLKR